MQLAEQSWPEVGAAGIDVVLLPVGSTEQHGPHAPLGTDTHIAEAITERGADRSEHTALIAPAWPIGVAEEHRSFAGSLWLTPETFRSGVRETVESIAHHGWTSIVIVNGHGGNVAALRELSARITRDEIARCVSFTWFDAIDVPSTEMGHGGAIETSCLLAIRPEVVRADRYEEARAGAAERWGRWVGGVNVAYDTDEFSASGIVGDPTGASARRGEDLLDASADALVDVIDDVVRPS